MRTEGIERIVRATRVEATTRAEPRRDKELIGAYRPHQERHQELALHGSSTEHGARSFGPETHAHSFTARPTSTSSRSAICGAASRVAPRRAITTTSSPSLRADGSVGFRVRNQSRTARLTRLRATALPTFRLAVMPRRTLPVAAGPADASSTTNSRDACLVLCKDTRL